MSDRPMTTACWPNCREAVRAAVEVPESFLEAGRAAFAWRTADAELAALTRDSATEPVAAGTRAAGPTVRSVSFVAHGLSIEVDLTNDALHGQVVPPQPGEVGCVPGRELVPLRRRAGTIAPRTCSGLPPSVRNSTGPPHPVARTRSRSVG